MAIALLVQLTVKETHLSESCLGPNSPQADSDCIHQLVLTTPRLPIDSKLYKLVDYGPTNGHPRAIQFSFPADPERGKYMPTQGGKEWLPERQSAPNSTTKASLNTKITRFGKPKNTNMMV